MDLTKETTTISYDKDGEDPAASLMIGHVDAETFNKAHKKAGWHCDDIHPDNLKHVYGRVCSNGNWDIKSNKIGADYLHITVTYW